MWLDSFIRGQKKWAAMTGIVASCSFGVGSAQAESFGLALVLDGSGSISSTDFALQTGAYQSILQDDFYTNYVESYSSQGNSFYLGTYQFSTSATREIDYTLIDSNQAAYDYGAQFSSISQQRGSTNTSYATTLATSELVSNGYDKKVIDVSTDGVPNYSFGAINAASAAKDSGVQVNALGVGYYLDETFLDSYTKAGDGFYKIAPDFEGFETVLAQKLKQQITGEPKPISSAVPEIDLAGGFLAFPLLIGFMMLLEERRRVREKESLSA